MFAKQTRIPQQERRGVLELKYIQEFRMKPFRHKTLEERVDEFGEQFDLDGEYDWGEQMGREVWE